MIVLKFFFVPIGLGLKYLHQFCYGDFYVGLGVLATDLRLRDCSSFVVQHRNKWGAGGIAKMGIYFDLPRCFFLDVFADYSFVKIDFCNNCGVEVQSHRANISGFSFGLGVGYRFS